MIGGEELRERMGTLLISPSVAPADVNLLLNLDQSRIADWVCFLDLLKLPGYERESGSEGEKILFGLVLRTCGAR